MLTDSTQKNVLIVEDDGIQQLIMKRLAHRLGLNVIASVSEGEKAVHVVKTIPGIDLIMMDVRLGDEIDGIEAMTKIRRLSDTIKVIYVTGNTEAETRSRADKTRYEAFLEKPVTEEKLKHALSEAFTVY